MRASRPGQLDKTHSKYTRRNVLCGSLGVLAIASEFTPLALAKEPGTIPYSPSAIDLEIVEIGKWLMEVEPDTAARIEAAARQSAGLTLTDHIDWPTAHKSLTVLAERRRTAEELDNGDIVFVDDWLLTTSEVGAALLFAAASSSVQGQ